MFGGSKGCLLALAAGVAALIFGVMMLVSLTGSEEVAAACSGGSGSQPSPSGQAKNSIPANYLALYQQAGQTYDVDWTLLAAVGEMESDHGRSNDAGIHSGANYAGAMGPMQFLAGTWAQYGVDGNVDGKKDVYDPADAIPGAANYLRSLGINQDPHSALYHYNGQGPQAVAYADEGLRLAKGYASGSYTISPDNSSATGADCSALGASDVSGGADCHPQGSGKALIAIQFACSKLGTPYLWGGTGPRYDCSGLVQAAWAAAGVQIPRTTWDQWAHLTPHLPYEQLQPGDLVFFYADLSHVGMYLGNGKFIQAPHTGDVVKISGMSTGYYRDAFQGGGQPS